MNLWKRFFGQKDSQARIALSFRQVGQPQMSPRNYESYAKQGYQKNVVVYRCVEILSKACGGIHWELYKKTRPGQDPTELVDHPLLNLLNKPNPMQGGASFFQYVMAYYFLTGNTFIEAVRPKENAPPMELWPTRPDRMSIVPDNRGYVGMYVLKAGDIIRKWPTNSMTLKADMFHMKSFNPTDIWWGQSPLEAAMLALDQSNSGQKWNLALMQNSATPSGILQVKQTDVNPSGSLTEEQFARLKSELDENYQGFDNAGRPMLIEGGLEWKQVSMSPKDMEFLKNKETSAIDICEAYGVPPEMLGLGQKTFNNYKEARMSFYEDTVLPNMDHLEDDLNNWLVPMFGEGLKLCYNRDDIEALAPKREAKFTSMQNADWLMINEKREATGYEPVEGWDVFKIGNELVADPSELMGEPDEPQDTENAPPQNGQPQKDPPPPANQNESDDESDADARDAEKAWKSFNLLNRNEKQTSWRRQNARRKKLEKPFEQDLNADFKDMYSDMARSIRGVRDPKLIEFALIKEMDKHLPIIHKTLERHIKYSVEAFGPQTLQNAKAAFPHLNLEKKSTAQYEDWARRYIKRRSGDAIGEIGKTTEKNVKRIVKRAVESAVIDGSTTDEVVNQLIEEIPDLTPKRAHTIARTEVSSATNNASLEAVKSLEIPNMKKEWVSSDDDRSRDGEPNGHGPNHIDMDGVRVDLDEKFNVPPDASMDGPGDTDGGADQIINCRCALVFSSANESRG